MKGFIIFIRKQGIMGLTIGFILGGSVSKLVSAFVTDIINPVIGLFFEKVDSLEKFAWTIGGTKILWGDFVSNLIHCFIITFVMYLLFKKLGMEKLDQQSHEKISPGGHI